MSAYDPYRPLHYALRVLLYHMQDLCRDDVPSDRDIFVVDGSEQVLDCVWPPLEGEWRRRGNEVRRIAEYFSDTWIQHKWHDRSCPRYIDPWPAERWCRPSSWKATVAEFIDYVKNFIPPEMRTGLDAKEADVFQFLWSRRTMRRGRLQRVLSRVAFDDLRQAIWPGKRLHKKTIPEYLRRISRKLEEDFGYVVDVETDNLYERKFAHLCESLNAAKWQQR